MQSSSLTRWLKHYGNKLPCSLHILFLPAKAPQTQRIADHRHRRDRHCCRSEDGCLLPQERDQRRENRHRDKDSVIGEGPEEILFDGAQSRTRKGQSRCYTLQIALDQCNIRSFHRNICSRPHSNSSISLDQGRSIVDAVAHKSHDKPLQL